MSATALLSRGMGVTRRHDRGRDQGQVLWRQECGDVGGGEPCPQDPSKGAQGCPEEHDQQPPGFKRASWNRVSFQLLGEQESKDMHGKTWGSQP